MKKAPARTGWQHIDSISSVNHHIGAELPAALFQDKKIRTVKAAGHLARDAGIPNYDIMGYLNLVGMEKGVDEPIGRKSFGFTEILVLIPVFYSAFSLERNRFGKPELRAKEKRMDAPQDVKNQN